MLSSRRTLLRTGLAGSLASILPVPGLRALAFAEAGPVRPILVVLHLRGGCDGLNFVSPATDKTFISARASELRVASDGPDAGYSLANALDPMIDFRLHAQAGGLAELYQGGQLGFIHAAGLTDGTRSHFVATDMIEHGVASAADLTKMTNGWLARALAGNPSSRLAAVAASASPAGDLSGLSGVLAVPDLSGGLSAAGGEAVEQMLRQLYRDAGGAAAASGRDALGSLELVDAHIARDDRRKPLPYQPAPGVKYDGAGEYARPLATVAQLVKMDIGIEAATVDLGGWDMHEYQAGRFKQQITKLSNGVVAFFNDLSAYHDRLIVVSITEFGRRLRSNRSNGTDHGRAGLMMVLGGRIRGGRFYGKWPGLGPDELDEGVDLRVTTDYRKVLTELAEAQVGHAIPNIFPGYHKDGAFGLYG